MLISSVVVQVLGELRRGLTEDEITASIFVKCGERISSRNLRAVLHSGHGWFTQEGLDSTQWGLTAVGESIALNLIPLDPEESAALRPKEQSNRRLAVGLDELWQGIVADDGSKTISPPSTPLGFSPGSRRSPKWRGWPLPRACQRVQRAVIEALDRSISGLSEHDLLALVAKEKCPAHEDMDLLSLVGDARWFAQDAGIGTNIRLTRDGATHGDNLARESHAFEDRSPSFIAPLRFWQLEALTAWAEHSRQGVVEAVTGTGKTRVGIEAVREALDDGFCAAVVVPTIELLYQWERALNRAGVHKVDLLGDGNDGRPAPGRCLVTTVHSMASRWSALPSGVPAMLVADECHRYGSPSFQEALSERFERRLGLTATFERSDEGIRDLTAYFGAEPLFRIDFRRALADEIVCRYVVMLLGVDFTSEEDEKYREADERCRRERQALLASGVPPEPFGEFMATVAVLAKESNSFLGSCAKSFLEAFSRRVELLSDASGKTGAVRNLAPAIRSARGAIIFSRRIDSAEKAAAMLVREGIRARAISSRSTREERRSALDQLRDGQLDALSAPQILDEGVDVPDVNLGIVIATTSSRRQMIQRMGRILRLKDDNGRARFVILYVKGTAEDPFGDLRAHEAFLDMITEHADAIESFDAVQEAEILAFAQQWRA